MLTGKQKRFLRSQGQSFTTTFSNWEKWFNTIGY